MVPLVLAVAAVLIALNEAGKLAGARWGLVGGLLVLAVVLFVVFGQVERRRARPLVNPEQLGQRATWALPLTTLLTLTGVFAVINGLVVSSPRPKMSVSGCART